MKNQTLRFLTMFIGALLISSTLSTNAIARSTGAPSPYTYTGSPGDGQNCTSCHGGSATPVTGWITSNIPAHGYTPGSSYTITVTATGTGRKGFEVSPQSLTGTQLGVLAAGTGSKLVGGTKYVTHSSAGASGSTSTWSFTWIAPVAGTGAVTFYGAIVVGQPNIKLTKLLVNEYVVIPLTATASATPSAICAGQSSQLNVTPSGGSGTYTYSWTSVPAGFTSTVKNPSVTPILSIQYLVHVSDGSVSADASTNVTVFQPPTASAGNDTTCAHETTMVPLNGSAANYSTVLWTTSGSGTFSAASELMGSYFPSAADITAGNVTLTLTASGQSACSTGASDTRIIHFDWATGIADTHTAKLNMAISPNPSTGVFLLRVSGLDDQTTTMIISDIRGRTIIQHALNASNINPVQFDMSGYPKGLYLVKIRTDNESMVRKLVIE